MASKRVVILCTSASKLGDTATGCWLEEVAAPFYVSLTTTGWRRGGGVAAAPP